MGEIIPILMEHASKSFVRKAEVGASRGRREWRQVLKDLSLHVKEGEIVCVLGRNGAGKTTLIRILSTLIEPDRGMVQVCGFDTMKQSGEVRRRLGVVLNAGEGGFHARLSALGNLEYYAALYKIPRREARIRVGQLMRDLGLEDRGSDQYQSYSSGMRRRLGLIRALLPDAPVMLLDEPTLGIDPWSTEQIHNHLLSLARQGKTILCASNSPTEARALASRVYALENGSLVQSKIDEVVAS